ncbi:pectinesterase family protein [Vreelandella zhanjiangensis]|uniref:pectinesterase family protein n=1 Tax=Vreelandella zhanjiangensis TaxID=1121960 RepID=UPI0003674D43|nr:pectinesterase family protein [Halomonas zhanjiangensis]
MNSRLFSYPLLATLITSTLSGAVYANGDEWNAIVSLTPQPGQYATITEALAAAPESNNAWRIFIEDGRWNERLIISKPVTLIGESREDTIIEADTPAGALDANGAKLGTSRTSTVDVKATGVTMENLTIRNSFDYPANKALPEGDPNKLRDTQAVALMLSNDADQARFRNVRLEGYQDTFYSKTGSRSYFTDCEISGHVDFIFGSGVAVFDNCDIIARNRDDIAPPLGYITAPSTNSAQEFGLIFLNSRIIKEEGVPAGSFALGRPWHPTTQFEDGRYADPEAIGLAAFINSEIDDHIYGWDRMSGTARSGDKVWFYPEDSRFYEFGNRGPGAGQGGEHYQLSASDAERYTLDAFFAGWEPELLN